MDTVRSADGTEIAYDGFGAGPPVVIVAGALCDRTANGPLAEELGRRGLRGITYDRRGRGDSGPAGRPDVAREVEDVAAVIEDVGAPVALYGHSSGAALALRAAAAGVRVRHLVLHEAPFNLDDPESRELSQRYRRELDSVLAAGDPAGAAELFLRTVGTPDEMIAGMRTEPWWPSMVAVAHTLAHDSEAMGDRDGSTVPTQLLGDVSVPTLVLYGDQSPPWMLEVADELVSGLPDAVLEVLEGQEHVVAPDVLAPVLERFVGSGATADR